MSKNYQYCPNCGIGLNSRETEMKFCMNCKHDWEEETENTCPRCYSEELVEIDDHTTKCMSCNFSFVS